MDKKAMKAYRKIVYGNPNWVDGRINRLEYLYRIIGLHIGLVLVIFFGGLGFGLGVRQSNVLGYAIAGIVALVSLSIVWQLAMADVKRFHDLEWSGWFVVPITFSDLGPLISSIMILFNPYFIFNSNFAVFVNVNKILLGISCVLYLILIFKRGTKGVNKYGKDPLVKGEE